MNTKLGMEETLLPATPAQEEDEKSGLSTTLAGGILACFMGAVGGISIGSSMFPPGTEVNHPEYLAVGIYWGLLTGVCANWLLLPGTKIPCCVGGTLFPSIIVIQKFAANNIGVDDPVTVLAAYVISTSLTGVLICLTGRLRVLRPAFRLCPFPVLLGFLTSIGVSLFDTAMGVPGVVPSGWKGKFDPESWANLRRDSPHTWLPGVVAAVLVFGLRRDWQWRPAWLQRYLTPLVSLAMILSVNLFHASALSNGWLMQVPGDGPTVFTGESPALPDTH
jgi:MFS superfamily sulfate permease-like transporter